MKRIFMIFAAALAWHSSALAASWCGASDAQNWQEFASTFWAGDRADTSKPVMYTLGAPWCPYCAQVFKTMHSGRFAFQTRFIPISARNETHRDQIADIVVDGTDKSLSRVYVQRVAAKTGYSSEQRTLANEVEEVVNQALYDRMGSQVPQWGSPMSFLLINGELKIVAGAPNIDLINQMVAQLGTSGLQSSTRRFLNGGLGAERSAPDRVIAKRDNVRIRVLPDNSALTHICLPANSALNASGSITVDGVEWLIFKQTASKNSNRVYARADEFRR